MSATTQPFATPPPSDSGAAGGPRRGDRVHDGVAPDAPPPAPRPVVLGVDQRAHAADGAVWVAAEWAARRHTDLKLVTAVDPPDPRAYRRARLPIAQAAFQAARHLDVDRRVHTSVVVGPAAAALIEESRAAGLVVLQRRRLGPLARLTEGSVSMVVAAHADCPVLVVHPADTTAEPRRDTGRRTEAGAVLLAVDVRGWAARAVDEAFQEASWRAAPLTVVHVWDAPLHGNLPPSEEEAERIASDARVGVAEQVAGCASSYPDVSVTVVLRRGDPAPVLTDLSASFDLLVVARHATGRHGHRNLGTVARRLIERAHCPVLVTPPTPMARPLDPDGRRSPASG